MRRLPLDALPGAVLLSPQQGRDDMTDGQKKIVEGREWIASLADAEGEHAFASEVRFGCWDHRSDVARAITGERFEVRSTARRMRAM
jgi:hypothetical protein